MKTKLMAISVLTLLLFGLLACFSASALPPDPLVVATDPLNGEVGVLPDVFFEAHASISQASGHPMMARCGTNATGVFIWSNWVGPTTNTTINFPFNASLYNHQYYWTVWANDSLGNSSNTTFSFTTEGRKPVVHITYPADGSTISSFNHIAGTCDNSSSTLFIIFFNLSGSRYWNWADGNWSLTPYNYTTPIGVTLWSVSSLSTTMPPMVNGNVYGIVAYANNTYNIGTGSSEFSYRTGSLAQNGQMGVIAKLIIELVLVFIALGLIYFVITSYFSKKRHSFKETIEMFATLFIGLICILIVVSIVAIL